MRRLEDKNEFPNSSPTLISRSLKGNDDEFLSAKEVQERVKKYRGGRESEKFIIVSFTILLLLLKANNIFSIS